MSGLRWITMVLLVSAIAGLFGCYAVPEDFAAGDFGGADGALQYDELNAALIPVGGDNESQSGGPIGFGPSLIWGDWLLESGKMLPEFIKGLATFSTTADVTGMTLNEDGTGHVYFKDRLTDSKDCVQVYALFDGETLVLDFSADLTSDAIFNLALEDYAHFFPVVDAGFESLGIADESGNVAMFSRQETMPSEVTCAELETVDEFIVPSPQFFSDLVLYNGELVYNSGAGNFEVFDLDTDTLLLPLAVTSSRLVQTVQDGYFWTHCGCGGSRDAFKRTLASVVDTISSEDEMGGAITFRAMAYNPMTDRLWLHGRAFDTQYGQFYVMNTAGEPDLVEDTVGFNRDLRALAWDGEDLWGIATIASQNVVRIDPATGKVLETYEVPDEDVSFTGLVFDVDFMYLLGTNLAGEGVIYRVMRP